MSNLHVDTSSADGDVVFTRAFKAPRQLVFDAHTKPELVRQWMLGPDGWIMPVCEIDLRPEGKFNYVWKQPETGATLEMVGVFREVDAPARTVHNENFLGEWASDPSHVTTEFREAGASATTLVMRVRFASQADRDAALATGMSDGMEIGYVRLDRLVADQIANATV